MNRMKRSHSTSFQLVNLHVRSDGVGRLDSDDRDNPTLFINVSTIDYKS